MCAPAGALTLPIMANPALDLSRALASATSRAAAGVVGLHRRRGAGTTAVVWNRSGLLLAASHALVGDSGTAVLPGGERREVEVIGRDPGTDLALLRAADPEGLAPLEFVDLDGVEVGHLALALGRPGQAIRASLRIVGVLGPETRTPAGGRLERHLESDRPLPRGFSGGPLVDLEGRALGVNTSALIPGAAIAIPRRTLVRVAAELEEHGSVRRGFLGVAVQRVRLPAVLAAELGRRTGALVVAVEDESPAAAAGLVLGDVILDLAGDPIRGPDELRALLLERRGERIAARILRAGARADLEVEVGERG